MALRPGSTLTCADHPPTINLLNAHAGVTASKHKIASDKYYENFAEFVKLFKESELDDSYLDNGMTTSVTRTYWTFLRCEKDGVRRVDDDGQD